MFLELRIEEDSLNHSENQSMFFCILCLFLFEENHKWHPNVLMRTHLCLLLQLLQADGWVVSQQKEAILGSNLHITGTLMDRTPIGQLKI